MAELYHQMPSTGLGMSCVCSRRAADAAATAAERPPPSTSRTSTDDAKNVEATSATIIATAPTP